MLTRPKKHSEEVCGESHTWTNQKVRLKYQFPPGFDTSGLVAEALSAISTLDGPLVLT